MQSTYLRLSTGTSRGMNTDGYTIVRVRDTSTGKTYRCMGGGYDMVGTVIADWACDVHQSRLMSLAGDAHATVTPDGYRSRRDEHHIPQGLYGMAAHYDAAGELVRVSVDGACGLESVRRILSACGVTLTAADLDRRGNAGGYMVTVSA